MPPGRLGIPFRFPWGLETTPWLSSLHQALEMSFRLLVGEAGFLKESSEMRPGLDWKLKLLDSFLAAFSDCSFSKSKTNSGNEH